MKSKAHLVAIVSALTLTGIVIPVARGEDRARWPAPAPSAGALTAPVTLQGLDAQWAPLATTRLARMRGGFDLPSGLNLSFGIERVVYVNGALVATTSLNIPDIARMTTDQAETLATIGQPMVVQVGAGNTFDPASMINAGAAGLVIQNTLDGQDIRALTTINVSVDTLGMFQDLNSQAALQNALLAVPGAP